MRLTAIQWSFGVSLGLHFAAFSVAPYVMFGPLLVNRGTQLPQALSAEVVIEYTEEEAESRPVLAPVSSELDRRSLKTEGGVPEPATELREQSPVREPEALHQERENTEVMAKPLDIALEQLSKDQNGYRSEDAANGEMASLSQNASGVNGAKSQFAIAHSKGVSKETYVERGSYSARYGKNRGPKYPLSARIRRQEGLVLLNVQIGADGTVQDLKLKEGSGFPVLDAAALAAVRQWRFEPARVEGIAITSEVEVPVRFQLRK